MIDMALLSILLPAMAAGFMVLLTHVPLGYQVLRRGIIFIDLAVAQIAALGIVCALRFHLDELHASLPYLISAGFALLGAVAIAMLEKRYADRLEALIGCIYVLAATAALLVLSQDPHGGEMLKQSLSGSILWVMWDDLLLHAVIYASVLSVLFWRPKLMDGHWFYVLFSLALTSSVELVGVYLVFASLIMLPLATFRWGRHRILWAYAGGIMAYAIGLLLSARFDLPSGATIVWCLAAVAVLMAGLIQPKLKMSA